LLRQYERFSSEVLDAASAPVRLQILKLLTSRGPLPYTEIMTEADLDPVRDAGKFVYHLKTLKRAGLVAVEKGTKKYAITELGRILVEFSRDLEEYAAVKKGRLFVRTSKMTIEEFDRTRIARSLVTEATMPQALANEIASEAEERLLRFGTTYITAPLIRELVNTILVERKLEEYRHRLTRLGLPVNDVTTLIREAGQKHLNSGWVEKSSAKAVGEEYVLLYSMTKSLADAHLSGRIHLDETDSWVLKPSQFFHDPRPFLDRGMPGSPPPSSLGAALALLSKLIRTCEGEVSGEQTLSHINYYLAPYAKNTPEEDLQSAISLFLFTQNWDGFSNNLPTKVTLGIDRILPEHLQGKTAIGPDGKKEGKYDDYSTVADKVSQTIISAATEASKETQLVNPAIVIAAPRDKVASPDVLASLAYQSSAQYSIPNFHIQDPDGSTVSSEGCVFQPDEGTSARGTILGSVLVNLPRAAYEAAGKDERFFEGVHEAALDAVKALDLRRSSIEERMKEGLLPLLSWQPDGQAYYSSSNVTGEIGLIGLAEALKHHTHAEFGERATIPLLKRVFDTVRRAIEESEARKLRVRVGLHPSPEASSRLASVDSEEFGFSTLVYQGSKKYPYYSDSPAVPVSQKIGFSSRAMLEGEVQKLFDGGSILPLRLGSKADTSSVARASGQLVQAGVRDFTYSRTFTICQRCHKPSIGMNPRCVNCNSDMVTLLARHSGRLLPLDMWPEALRRDLERLTGADVN
jgi:ribonucleoside-triphosphate reductase (formate)